MTNSDSPSTIAFWYKSTSLRTWTSPSAIGLPLSSVTATTVNRGVALGRNFPRSLSPENEQVWEHYRECRAVGQFPDDPLVRRHAALIRETEDECHRFLERTKLYEMFSLLAGR